MINDDIIDKISKELNISKDTVEKVYKYYWLFIRTKIQELPLKENLSEEKFKKLQTNFNIPSIGKLICPYDKYLKRKESFKRAQITNLRNDKD